MRNRKKISRLYSAIWSVRVLNLTEALANGTANALMFLDVLVAVKLRNYYPRDFDSDWDYYNNPVQPALAKKVCPVVEAWDEKYGPVKTGYKTNDHIWARHDLLRSSEFIESLNDLIVNITNYLSDEFTEEMQEKFGKAIGLVYTLSHVKEGDGEEIITPKYVKMCIELLDLMRELLEYNSTRKANKKLSS